MRLTLWGLLAALVASPVTGDALHPDQAKMFASFAAAVSGGDEAIVAQAADLIASPPTTLETIGFYGLEGAPAGERTLRGIISILGNAGYIIEIEDKYLYEFPAVLSERGILPEIDHSTDLGLMARIEALLVSDNSNQTDPDFVQMLREEYWMHVAAIEAEARAKGFALMHLSLPLGDTFYVWAAPLDQEQAWLGKEIYRGPNTLQFAPTAEVAIGLNSPDWEVYWGMLTYALLLPEDQWSLPAR